jgi:hypothetical protein
MNVPVGDLLLRSVASLAGKRSTKSLPVPCLTGFARSTRPRREAPHAGHSSARSLRSLAVRPLPDDRTAPPKPSLAFHPPGEHAPPRAGGREAPVDAEGRSHRTARTETVV